MSGVTNASFLAELTNNNNKKKADRKTEGYETEMSVQSGSPQSIKAHLTGCSESHTHIFAEKNVKLYGYRSL